MRIWWYCNALDQRLCRIETKLDELIRVGRRMMATNQEILDEVTAESTVADSILALVQRLVSEDDPAVRQAILDGLVANRAKLEAAVLAGTPQAPPAPPV